MGRSWRADASRAGAAQYFALGQCRSVLRPDRLRRQPPSCGDYSEHRLQVADVGRRVPRYQDHVRGGTVLDPAPMTAGERGGLAGRGFEGLGVQQPGCGEQAEFAVQRDAVDTAGGQRIRPGQIREGRDTTAIRRRYDGQATWQCSETRPGGKLRPFGTAVRADDTATM